MKKKTFLFIYNIIFPYVLVTHSLVDTKIILQIIPLEMVDG